MTRQLILSPKGSQKIHNTSGTPPFTFTQLWHNVIVTVVIVMVLTFFFLTCLLQPSVFCATVFVYIFRSLNHLFFLECYVPHSGIFFSLFFRPSPTGILVLICVLISLYSVSLFLSHLHMYSQGSSVNSGVLSMMGR